MFPLEEVPALDGFASEVSLRKALGLIVAMDFAADTRERLQLLKLTPLSCDQLAGIVALWDPLKQRIAARAFLYYASHVEQNGALVKRTRDFFDSFQSSPSSTV